MRPRRVNVALLVSATVMGLDLPWIAPRCAPYLEGLWRWFLPESAVVELVELGAGPPTSDPLLVPHAPG